MEKLLHQKQLSKKYNHHHQQQQQVAFKVVLMKQEEFDRFFNPLKSKVLEILKSPESTTEAYVFSGNTIDNNPVLMTSMYELIRKANVDIHIAGLRRYAARKLLEWLTHERPDIVFELLCGFSS